MSENFQEIHKDIFPQESHNNLKKFRTIRTKAKDKQSRQVNTSKFSYEKQENMWQWKKNEGKEEDENAIANRVQSTYEGV